MSIYLRGVLIGVLVIRRTLAAGRATGVLSGLGAATADAIYASIAAFGLTFVSGFLIAQQLGLRLAGGLFLCYLGTGTALWMSSLSTLASTARERLRAERLRWVNRGAGIVVVAFGLVALASID